MDATPHPHDFRRQALEAVIEEKADLATAADTPVMFALLGGRKITTQAVIHTADRNEAIVACL